MAHIAFCEAAIIIMVWMIIAPTPGNLTCCKALNNSNSEENDLGLGVGVERPGRFKLPCLIHASPLHALLHWQLQHLNAHHRGSLLT